jgi:hypothetical protein
MTQEPRFKIIGNEVKGDGKTYIASPELIERFGDKEFGEVDFVVKNVRVDWHCLNGYEYGDMAFPVSQEQESQEEDSSPLWVEVEKIAWLYRSGKINYIGMMKMLQRDFEIKRRNTTP